MAERRYKCWQCHEGGFLREDLIGHRCSACRGIRKEIVRENPDLAATPWSVEGQQVWTKDGGLGEDGGVHFRERKQPISEEKAEKSLVKLKELKTWKNGSRS